MKKYSDAVDRSRVDELGGGLVTSIIQVLSTGDVPVGVLGANEKIIEKAQKRVNLDLSRVCRLWVRIVQLDERVKHVNTEPEYTDYIDELKRLMDETSRLG